MPTKDSFNPDEPLPLFLADRTEQPRVGSASDRAIFPPRALTASILVLIAAATALGIAVFSTGSPVTLFANLTASLVDQSALQPGTDQSPPTIQAAADAQALPPTATDAPTGGEIAAAEPAAGQDQAKMSESASEALLRQFQAWAAEEDAQAQAEPAQPVQHASVQPVEDTPTQPVGDTPAQPEQDADAPAQVAQDAPAQDAPVAREAREPLRLTHKQRHLESIRNAHAEMLRQESRKMVRREQHSRLRARPAQAVGAQDQLVQNAEPPSLLQGFGLRN